jgi:hypothetical protein
MKEGLLSLSWYLRQGLRRRVMKLREGGTRGDLGNFMQNTTFCITECLGQYCKWRQNELSVMKSTVFYILTGRGLDGRGVGVRLLVGARVFSSPQRPDRFWGPPSLLYNGYRRHFGRGVKLTTHLELVPRSKIRGSIHPLPHTPSCRVA